MFPGRGAPGVGGCGGSAGTMTRKPHRNGRGLFLGAILGAVAGFFAGRMMGNAALGILVGAVVGSALLYRVNPGPWNRP